LDYHYDWYIFWDQVRIFFQISLDLTSFVLYPFLVLYYAFSIQNYKYRIVFVSIASNCIIILTCTSFDLVVASLLVWLEVQRFHIIRKRVAESAHFILLQVLDYFRYEED